MLNVNKTLTHFETVEHYNHHLEVHQYSLILPSA